MDNIDLILKNNDYKIVEGSIYSFAFKDNPSIEMHDGVGGSKIKELESIKFTLPYWESRYYYGNIEKSINLVNRNSIVLDVGCGDGRFTLFLIEKGFKNIFALDSNIHSLLSLKTTLRNKKLTNYVTLIHDDVLSLPFYPNSFNLVFSIGVLYYLNKDYECGLRRIVKTIKKNGILVETEPSFEGSAIKSLLFDGLEQFLNTGLNSEFIEIFKNEKVNVRCFKDEELYDIFTDNNLKVQWSCGISLFPTLVRILEKKGILSKNKLLEKENKIFEIFDYFNDYGRLYKHKLWLLKKI